MRVGTPPAASLDYGERGSSSMGPVRSACQLGQEFGAGKPHVYGMQKSDELIVPLKRRTSEGQRRKPHGWRLEFVEGRGSSLAVLDAGHHYRYTEEKTG